MDESSKVHENKIKLKIIHFVFKLLLRLHMRKLITELGFDETVFAENFVNKIIGQEETYEIEGIRLKKEGKTRLYMLTGVMEPSQTDLMKKIVKPGMNVFDLGANFGWFTLVLSKLVGNSGRVYSFEADPSLIEIFAENVKLNNFSNVSIQSLAVSDKTGISKFSINKSYDTRSRLDPISLSENTIDVKTISLDEFCLKENLKKVDFIKMDIEGSEPKALEGMRKIISDNPQLKIILEFNQNSMHFVGTSPDFLINFLLKEGFSLEEIDKNKPGKLKKISKEQLLEKKVCNCYCYKA